MEEKHWRKKLHMKVAKCIMITRIPEAIFYIIEITFA